MRLAFLDYLCLAAYLGATLAIGLWVARRIKTGSDYFLAGRNLPWWAIGMSLVATDIGGTDIIGVAGSSYKHGLAVANFEWIGCVPAMILAAFVFIPHFWRVGLTTVPEFMERRYNARVRTALAVCWLLFMACNLGVMLLASARLIKELVGWDPGLSIVLTAVVVALYTISGGLAAVVYTDVMQCLVLIGGCLLMVVLGLIEVGGPAALKEKSEQIALERRLKEDPAAAAGPGHMALVQPADTTTPFPWTGIFFGLFLILSPAYWVGNQAIVQRALGARSEFEAKAAYVWGALIKNLFPFLIAVPGLIALVLRPDLDNADRAVPTLVAEFLPAGIRGIFLAAFLAAMMSSVDSYLNSAATLYCNDLHRRFLRPQITEQRLVLVGRITTCVLMVWGAGFAFLLKESSEGIYALFQTLMSFFTGPAFVLLACGLFWRRATGAGALVGFVGGVATTATLYVLSLPAVYERLGWRPLFQIEQPFLYYSVWASLVALVLLVAVSLLTRPEPEEKLAQMIRRPRP